MRPWELFETLRSLKYKTVGRNLDYQFYVDHEYGVIYVCFQETEGTIDWKNNLRFWAARVRPYRGCNWWAHSGHVRVWRSANDVVIAEIGEMFKKWRQSRKDPNTGEWGPYELVFAGFSKGASMAQLAAEDWHFRTGQKCRVIGFGGAKVAHGADSVSYLGSCMSLTHFIHRNDLVGRLPPFSGWAHSRRLVWLGPRRGNPFKILFGAQKYHQSYGDMELYR